jgi:penicillin amidase
VISNRQVTGFSPLRPLARGALRLALGRRLPIASGTIAVGGIENQIVIRRDSWGIPSIDAESDADAWFGLGFVHGQDRAFQLEMALRLVRGTVSELVGPPGLAVDRISRRIGFRRSAEARLAVMDPALRRDIEAYARGATAGATEGLPRKAHEFALLRAEPTPHTAADTAGILGFLSFAIASNWDVELARLRILLADGPEAMRALDPRPPEWLPVAFPPGATYGPERRPGGDDPGGAGTGTEAALPSLSAAIDRLASDTRAFLAAAGGGGGSNNWAIAPSRTATGRPLLANDPHLTSVLPPHWYLARLRTPEWTAAGATLAGTPGITVGHNETMAWGTTAGLSDNTDLFVEELGDDGRSVRAGDGFEPCEVIRETIHVRGSEDAVEDVLITPRGPLLVPPSAGERRGLSLRAVWLDALPLRGTLVTQRARTIEELRAAFAEWPVLPMNVVFAATDGSIAWQLAGRAPRRRKGWGTFPLAGWDRDAGWEVDPVAFEDMPRASDPECGFIATANQAPLRPGEGPWLGVDWIDGYRLARIHEALAGRADWDIEGTMRLQLDVGSIPWREVRSAVLAAPARDPAVRKALAVLADWDGNVTAGAPAAAVFEVFMGEVSRMVVLAKAPVAAEWALGRGVTPLAPRSSFALRLAGRISRLLREEPSGWFDRPWREVIAEALATAVHRLEDAHGADPSRWAWGRVRKLTFRHALGARRGLGLIFDRGPLAVGGDTNTVAQASVDPLDPLAGTLYTASLRAVMDVGCWERSRFVLPGGQSGNPLSPHYDDQLDLWLRGEGLAMAWTEAEVVAATRSTLVLVPAAPGGVLRSRGTT